MAKELYYNIENLLSIKAQYNILLGQRSNGKSYQVKQLALKKAYNTGRKFIYLRRWKEDIKISAVESYFEDMPIKEITNGDWDSVIAFRGNLYFQTVIDGKKIKSEPIGKYCALNESERYKSWAFPDYDIILYEEFITDKAYLFEEPKQLQQFVSTVSRRREIAVYMIGNTLSRVCPYFIEWCLEGVLNQKQGTIEVYHYHTDDDVINIAVEYCANLKSKNRMFFGQTAKQIVSGEWDTKEVPKLPKKQYDYEKVYEVLLKYQKLNFVIELLVEPVEGGVICHIYPYTRNRKIYRILSEEFSDKPNITSKLDISKKPERMIADCLRLGKVCYSDNLTGSDFNNVLKVFRI